jgi:hypothetical protein
VDIAPYGSGIGKTALIPFVDPKKNVPAQQPSFQQRTSPLSGCRVRYFDSTFFCINTVWLTTLT